MQLTLRRLRLFLVNNWHWLLLLIFYSYSIDYSQRGHLEHWNLAWCLFAFVVALKAPRFVLPLIVFSMPFCTALELQVNQLFNLEIKPISFVGFDVVLGAVLGMLVKQPVVDRRRGALSLIVIMCLFLSAILSVARNLYSLNIMLPSDLVLRSVFKFRELYRYHSLVGLREFIELGLVLLFYYIAKQRHLDRKLKFQDAVLVPVCISSTISALYAVAQNVFSIGYSRDSTRGVTSFLSDIHSFAALMTIGFFASLLLLFITTTSRKRLFLVMAMSLNFTGIYLSGSRAQLGIAVLLLIFVLPYLVYLHRDTINKKITCAAIALSSLVVVGFLHQRFDYLYRMIVRQGEQSWNTFNNNFSFRPEIWEFAWKTITDRPFVGMGAGMFNKVSGLDFYNVTSPFLLRVRGENAHNYFLQFVSEYGLIGLSAMALLFVAPLKKNLYVWVFVAALFSTNIFAHSFLEREFFVLLIVCLVFIDQGDYLRFFNSPRFLLFAFPALIAIYLLAFYNFKEPFEKNQVCSMTQGFYEGSWIGGSFIDEDGVFNSSDNFTVHTGSKVPQDRIVSFGYSDTETEEIVQVKNIVLEAKTSAQINLPTRPGAHKFFKINGCYKPVDFLKSGDIRVLGLRIKPL